MNTYHDALAFIASRHKFKRDPTLDRMRLFMKKLGNPQNKIKHMIHVTGTNGKGSVVTFLRNLFQQSGYSVGTFTSPYLVTFNEWISVNGKPVSNSTILRLAKAVAPVAEALDKALPDGGPTEFEVITAMMFKYFAEHHADVVIVEVGIGGRYDSTNVLIPDVSAITTVSWDHMKILGDTLPKIAYQKAGIIKQGKPVVAGRISKAPLDVIKKTAAKKHSHLSILGRDFLIKHHQPTGWNEIFDFKSKGLSLHRAKIQMVGTYEIDNAAVAVETYLQYCRVNGLHVDPNIIRKGLAGTFWAGRFERLNGSPIVVIDGAHNVPAIKAIQPILSKRFAQRDVYVILAIFADKQYQQMVKILSQIHNVHLVLTEFHGPGHRGAADLKPLAEDVKAKHPIKYIPNWKQAIVQTVSMMSQDDVLLITGSLYFISNVRPLFINQKNS